MRFTLYKNVLNEGIDVDNIAHTVTFNPTHEKLVNTSRKTNPSANKGIFSNGFTKSDKDAYTNGTFNNITVWSIFKRFGNGTLYDGNPLIYALKGENKWKFSSDENKKKFFERVDLIIKKFLKMATPDTIIVLPSSNKLNQQFAEMFVANSNCKIINDVLLKITVNDVIDCVYEEDSEFRIFYGADFDAKYNELVNTINRNIRKNKLNSDSIIFKRHWITDDEMRNVIDRTMVLNCLSYGDDINNKKVLLVDDIISRGASIREAIKVLKQQYDPLKIDVITLLSKRY